MHSPALVAVVTLGLITILMCDTTEARWPCRPCQNEFECNQQPTEACPFGVTKNACLRLVCAKGPGERCGGPLDIMGKCGQGLTCKTDDGRCHGCSTTMYECE